MSAVVLKGVIQQDCSSDYSGSCDREAKTYCVLQIKVPPAFCDSNRWREHRMARAVGRRSRWKRCPHERTDKVEALVFGCGEQTKLHQDGKVAKAVARFCFMHDIRR